MKKTIVVLAALWLCVPIIRAQAAPEKKTADIYRQLAPALPADGVFDSVVLELRVDRNDLIGPEKIRVFMRYTWLIGPDTTDDGKFNPVKPAVWPTTDTVIVDTSTRYRTGAEIRLHYSPALVEQLQYYADLENRGGLSATPSRIEVDPIVSLRDSVKGLWATDRLDLYPGAIVSYWGTDSLVLQRAPDGTPQPEIP